MLYYCPRARTVRDYVVVPHYNARHVHDVLSIRGLTPLTGLRPLNSFALAKAYAFASAKLFHPRGYYSLLSTPLCPYLKVGCNRGVWGEGAAGPGSPHKLHSE